MRIFPYQFLEEYVFRAPIFSSRKFKQKFSLRKLEDNQIKEICKNSIFEEAIYLASPELHHQIHQWKTSQDKILENRLKHSIIKYYIRMSTRCTPFGLFSGVGHGSFTKIENKTKETQHLIPQRDSKLDMHFLISLVSSLEANPLIQKHLKYFPNNTIYHIGKNIRYIEYNTKNGKREYFISSALLSAELKNILEFSKEGKTLEEISKTLVNQNISYQESLEFIDELTINQLLVSELAPIVSGIDYFDYIISVLERIGIGIEKETKALTEIKTKLENIDRHIGNSIELYSNIEDLARSLGNDFEKKYLFQTDLYFQESHKISNHWKKDIKKTINLLNKISNSSSQKKLNMFKKHFIERFDLREMPLLYVLDSEIGIGYGENSQAGIHTYLEDLILPLSKNKKNLTVSLNSTQITLNEKIQNAIRDRDISISINENDFDSTEDSYDDTPNTISVMAEIISLNENEKLYIKSIGGTSAANLLGRFASKKSPIHLITKNITLKEDALKPDSILAEIIHLPEARIGNIIRRPSLRQYEIPFLAQSSIPEKQKIELNDLYVSIKNNNIILRSKRLNKEVQPYLSNAHNYHNNSLPIYQFLCDLQTQNIRTSLSFNWDGLKAIYSFLPRVEYNNIILSKATWKINIKDFVYYDMLLYNEESFFDIFREWREKLLIPEWIQIVKSDNILPLNLENIDMFQIFFETLRREKTIIIEEFLYNKNDEFSKELNFLLYKTIKS